MTLTELRYIVAVSRELHFGKAAASCFVSQPTLSVAVKKLEEELGVTIFERHQHDVTITPVGKRILEQAQHTLEQATLVKQIADEGKDQLKGSMNVGVIYTIGPYLLPRIIPKLLERAPDLNLIIEEDYTHNLAEKLKPENSMLSLSRLPSLHRLLPPESYIANPLSLPCQKVIH